MSGVEEVKNRSLTVAALIELLSTLFAPARRRSVSLVQEPLQDDLRRHRIVHGLVLSS